MIDELMLVRRDMSASSDSEELGDQCQQEEDCAGLIKSASADLDVDRTIVVSQHFSITPLSAAMSLCDSRLP